jgi:hypothetical protein
VRSEDPKKEKKKKVIGRESGPRQLFNKKIVTRKE